MVFFIIGSSPISPFVHLLEFASKRRAKQTSVKGCISLFTTCQSSNFSPSDYINIDNAIDRRNDQDGNRIVNMTNVYTTVGGKSPGYGSALSSTGKLLLFILQRGYGYLSLISAQWEQEFVPKTFTHTSLLCFLSTPLCLPSGAY